MIGPDHYREAEKLLGILTAGCDDDQEIANVLAAAQVHATLALASATALAIEATPDAVALWDDLVLDEDAIVEHVDEDDDAAAVAAYDRAVEADTGRRVSLDQPCTVCGVVLGEHDDRIPAHEWIGGPR